MHTLIFANPVLFLSTLSLRRATRPQPPKTRVLKISIHALLAESDHGVERIGRSTAIFLSTLSLRRATKKGVRSNVICQDFYPRSPCGERL